LCGKTAFDESGNTRLTERTGLTVRWWQSPLANIGCRPAHKKSALADEFPTGGQRATLLRSQLTILRKRKVRLHRLMETRKE
jgi:hypothetical protein